MDSIVQLIRNALCVCKDLELLRNTFLWDNKILNIYYKFKTPYNQTTPLECLISISQAYVIYSGVPSSIHMIILNYNKLQRIQNLMKINSKEQAVIMSNDIVSRLMDSSLYNEGLKCIRNIFIGFNCFCIAISFIWLAGNSWHITETNIIGGIQGLIHALTVMNICLTPILYYMYIDSINHFNHISKMKIFIKQLQDSIRNNNKSTIDITDMNVSKLDLLLSVASSSKQSSSEHFFWCSNSTNGGTTITDIDEEKLLLQEQQKIKDILGQYRITNNDTNDTAIKKKNDDISKDDDNDNDQYEQLVHETIYNISDMIPVITVYGYREFVYLILNFIAWYGYGLCILAYYYSDDDTKIANKPYWIQQLFFNMNSKNADYYGNLAGDCMWTIEPIIALLSPIYITYITSQRKSKRNSKDHNQPETKTSTTMNSDKSKTE